MDIKKLNDVTSLINDYKNSVEYNDIITQQNYYINNVYEKKKGLYINNRIVYYDEEGNYQPEIKSELSVAFFRKLVDQKINYLVGNPMNLECDEIIKEYFDSHLYKAIHSAMSDAVKHGQGWLMSFYDENELKFKYVPTRELYPVWKDYDKTTVETMYRFFEHNGKSYIIVYDKDGITTIEDEKIIGLNEPLLTINKEPYSFMPFIYFDYNYERISLLNFVKDLIDDFNAQLSSRSSNLLNITRSIKVIKNYDGTDILNAEKMMNRHRVVGVTEGGDVKVIEVPIESVAVDAQLDQLMESIYDAGRGVNFTRENLGNASGIALKFKYSDLDADTDNMSMYFKEGIEKIFKFISKDLEMKGMYHSKNFKVVFNKNRIINETEMVDNIVKLQSILSNETLISLIPFDVDVQKEIIRKEQEQKESLKEEYNYDSYGTTTNSDQSGTTN